MINLKHILSHELLFRKVHRVIKFNQEAWLKLYIDINTAKKKSKKWFWKRFFWVSMNSAVFELWTMWENRDIKVVTAEAGRNFLVSEPKYYTTKCFFLKSISYRKKIFMDTDSFTVYIKTEHI